MSVSRPYFKLNLLIAFLEKDWKTVSHLSDANLRANMACVETKIIVFFNYTSFFVLSIISDALHSF